LRLQVICVECWTKMSGQATRFVSNLDSIWLYIFAYVYIPSYHHKMLRLYPHSFPPQAPVQMGTPTTNPGGPHPGSGRQRNSIRIGMVFVHFCSVTIIYVSHGWIYMFIYIYIYTHLMICYIYIYMYICTYIVLHIYTHSYPCAYKLCKPEIGLSFRLHVCKWSGPNCRSSASVEVNKCLPPWLNVMMLIIC